MDELDHPDPGPAQEKCQNEFLPEIGNAVGISRVSVKKRMTAMENAGIIRGYHAVTDEEQIRKGIRYTIDIECDPGGIRRSGESTAKRPGAGGNLQHDRSAGSTA